MKLSISKKRKFPISLILSTVLYSVSMAKTAVVGTMCATTSWHVWSVLDLDTNSDASNLASPQVLVASSSSEWVGWVAVGDCSLVLTTSGGPIAVALLSGASPKISGADPGTSGSFAQVCNRVREHPGLGGITEPSPRALGPVTVSVVPDVSLC